MRVLAISDTHGRSSPVETAIERSKPDIVIFLGDGLQALKDLPFIYTDIRFYFVRGNCDFDGIPATATITVGGKTIFFTHGHNYYVKSGLETLKAAARSAGADIALFGHTHIAYSDYDDGLYLLNPGSASVPQNGKPSYGYVDIVGGSVVTNIVYL